MVSIVSIKQLKSHRRYPGVRDHEADRGRDIYIYMLGLTILTWQSIQPPGHGIGDVASLAGSDEDPGP